MAKVKCKGCGEQTSNYDTIDGYCLVCVEKKVRQFDQLCAENERQAEEIERLKKNQFPEPPICQKCGKPKLCGGVLWLQHIDCKGTSQ